MDDHAAERTTDSGHASPRVFTAREAAAQLGLHERTIRRAINRGALPATKISGVFQITAAALSAFQPRDASETRRSHSSSPADRPAGGTFPRPLTALIGREREMALLVEHLRGTSGRLMTLTGPGGVGKTRLALGAAEAAAASFATVLFVDLTPVRDPARVVAAVAQQLGGRQTENQPPIEALKLHLQQRDTLLLLDNFEQVLDAAPWVTELLSACPALRVLVTSRAQLRLSGEQVIPVEPLALPEPGAAHVTQMADAASVRLFVERARAVNPAFALTPDNCAVVAEICRRLDGLPLALELAAARTTLLPPPALLARLKHRLPLLCDGVRDAPARHHSLRQAIAWSYDLLTPAQRALFRRLSVCTGGFTIESAQAIAEDRSDALIGIGALVEASLVRRADGECAEPRFTLLETVREYALEQLTAHGEVWIARRAHAVYMLSLAQRDPLAFMRPHGERWLRRLEQEHANLKAALVWFAENDDAEQGLALAAALGWFWFGCCHFREGEEWLERMLAERETASPALRASALASLARVVAYQGDERRARPLCDAALAALDAISDTMEALYTLVVFGAIATQWKDYRRAEALLGEALRQAPGLADPVETAIIAGEVCANLGAVAQSQGDPARAAEHYAQGLAHFRAADHAQGEARALRDLGDATRDAGDHERAVAFYRQSLALVPSAGNARVAADALDGVAIAAVAWRQVERGARLFGAADAVRERARIGIPLAADRAARERSVVIARCALGGERFTTAWSLGRSLPIPAVLAEVEAAAPPAARRTPSISESAYGLTQREREVLAALVRRQSNQDIAAALFISYRTVESHVSHILAKLGASTRAEAAAIVLDAGIVRSQPPKMRG